MSIFLAVSAFLLAVVFSWRLAQPESRWHFSDVPNERSLHTIQKGRTGGLAILLGAAIPLCYAFWVSELPLHLGWVLVPIAGIFMVSLLDDLATVSPIARFAVHLSVSLFVVASGAFPPISAWVNAGWWPWAGAGVLFGFLATGWMLNLYNFMDGMDGFAGFMTVTGFGALAYLGWEAGEVLYFQINLCISAAALGFLVLNFPPSRVFLGDVGACSLGLLAATSSLWGLGTGMYSFWVPLVIFSPFFTDATLTLLLRCLRGEKVWLGDRNHFYHKVLLRIGHRDALKLYWPLMMGTALTAVLFHDCHPTVAKGIVIAWGSFYALLYMSIYLYSKKTEVLDELKDPTS